MEYENKAHKINDDRISIHNCTNGLRRHQWQHNHRHNLERPPLLAITLVVMLYSKQEKYNAPHHWITIRIRLDTAYLLGL